MKLNDIKCEKCSKIVLKDKLKYINKKRVCETCFWKIKMEQKNERNN